MTRNVGLMLLGFISLAACSSPQSLNVTGTWEGTSINVNNYNAVLNQKLVLVDNAGDISGSIYVKSSDGSYVYAGPVSGSRVGNSASMTVYFTVVAASAYYSGTFTNNTFSGNYTASGGGAGPVNLHR